MADVTDNRGQLILVTGLLVAVAMIALVLLLNTAIYTENLASRGADQSGREAIEYRSTVEEGVGGLLDDENDREHESQTAVEDNVTDGIHQIDDYTARVRATGGDVAWINRSSLTLHEGALIRQTKADRDFANESSTATDWELASDVEDTRAFTMAVDDSNLTDTDESNARSDGAFHVFLDGSSDWEVFVYDKGAPEIAIATGTGASLTERCSTTESRATINLTAGTLNGEPCPGLTWADGISGDYDVEFRNAGDINGTYDLTINTTTAGTAINSTNLNDGTASQTSPYHVPAVYSATFHLNYESPTLTYGAEVRVAPGEPE